MKSMKVLSNNYSKNSARQVERHLNLRLLPVLMGIFAIIYILTGYRGWYVFFLGMAGAWLIAWLWTHSIERNLWIERRTHLAWATVGESVPEQLKLINKSWLPAIWVEITDASSTLETPLRLVSDVAQHSYRNRHLSHLFKRRGLYTLGPTRIRSGDPFGIYTVTLFDHHATTILITPPILPLAQLKIPAGGWSGDERQRRESIERIISDAGVRNYVPGDSLRRIHWRASAHFDTLIVRQLEAATFRDWWIFVDLNSTVQAGSGQQTTLELSIVLAASLAVRGLKEHRRVGLVLAGPSLVWLEPRADPAQRWRILRALSVAEAGNHSLADLLTLSRPTQATTTILITPSTDPTWVAAANRYRKGGSLIALLVDPTDFGSLIGQSEIASALDHSRISYLSMPGSLLEKAYASSDQTSRRRINEVEFGKRYMQPGRPDWQW
jgi:uncharacterized protein (DUF58 family)